MILSAHQPAYLPWLGYFEKIQRSDVFVYLDTVQFEKNSFTNRNKIKTPEGEQWLTVPVRSKGHTTDTMRNLLIDKSREWKRKHLGSIHANYKKAPRFDLMFPALEHLYAADHEFLADLCYEQLIFWLGQLGVKTRLVKASTLRVHSAKSDLVLDLCRALAADRYLSGAQGRDYIQVEAFEQAGIEVAYQDYRHPTYPQLWGGAFIPRLSILDFLMNTDDLDLIWGGRG